MLTEDMLETRLSYITGTDAPIICGLSKYCTPYQLWLYKTRREVAPDISDKPSVKAGNMLEGAVRDWLGKELGKDIYDRDGFDISENYNFMAGNVDGHIAAYDSTGGWLEIVEIKTASSDIGWGESGSQMIPQAYRIQIAHYMAVCNATACYVGVLIRGVDFRWYRIERDYDLEDWLITKEIEFWNCVQADVEPEPSNTQDVVRMLEGKCTDQSKVADLSTEAHVLHYKELREQIKHLEEAQERVKLEICKNMGEASVLVDRGGRVIATWKKPQDMRRFDSLRFAKECPKLHSEYMYNIESSRRFLVK